MTFLKYSGLQPPYCQNSFKKMTRKSEGEFLCGYLFFIREREVSIQDSSKGQAKQKRRLPSSLLSIFLLALSGARLPSWVAMVTQRARFSQNLGQCERRTLRRPVMVPFTTEEYGRTRCPARD